MTDRCAFCGRIARLYLLTMFGPLVCSECHDKQTNAPQGTEASDV